MSPIISMNRIYATSHVAKFYIIIDRSLRKYHSKDFKYDGTKACHSCHTSSFHILFFFVLSFAHIVSFPMIIQFNSIIKLTIYALNRTCAMLIGVEDKKK
eukprot:954871_1